jgi:mannose-6-phosphate isomerase-like protein (cupin superfamily)
MIITRMFKGEEGISHFEDLEIPARETRVGTLSKWFAAEDVLFREVEEGLFLDWHHADSRVLIVILSGRIEVTLGSGTRQFGPGEMVLAEDIDGQGHQTRDIEGPRRSIMIRVPDEFDVAEWRRP